MLFRSVEWLFKHPLSDGGTFTGVADLVAKYGIVPAGVMPETYASNNTSRFTSLIARKLREDGLILREKIAAGAKSKEVQALKDDMLSEVYHILVLGFGEPVTTFTWAPKDAQGKYMWEPKEYTPQSFYAGLVAKSGFFTLNLTLYGEYASYGVTTNSGSGVVNSGNLKVMCW